MKLIFYNTLTRKKEVFKPLKSDFVRMYDCGPTVYFYAHIGNMWRYIMSDLIRRVLEYNGYKVKQVINITDVGHLTEDDLLAADTGEDKVAAAARREKKTPAQIAEFYTKAFFKDTERLNILRPHVIPKATEHIKEMIELIKMLEKKGFVYQAGDYVCFDIAKFSQYGKLSGKKLEDLRVGARLEPVPGKHNPYDFALWIVDSEHLMQWDSPWGRGYPGWHIECSAMGMKYLGEQLDIHTGGEDNIFPHHENEIAQSEGATGKEFVHFWIHCRHNLADGKKMSKSKGNFYLLQDIVDKGFDPLTFRYLCLTTHYRSKFNFTWEGLRATQKALERLKRVVVELDGKAAALKALKETEGTEEFRARFLEAVNDDLDMPRALAVVWEVVKSKKLDNKNKKELILDFDRVLGLGLAEVKPLEIPAEIKALAAEREDLRKQGKWAEADKIRTQITEQGFGLEDTEMGTKIIPN